MPAYNPINRTLPPKDTQTYVVTKNGKDQHANVLQRRKGEIYVHYFNTDKRLDDWVPEDTVHLLEEQPQASSSSNVPNGRKRKRKQQPGRVGSSTSPVRQDSVETAVEEPEPEPPLLQEDVQLTEEEFDYQKHKQMTGQRNYDKVNFGTWQIKTWYHSPYPLSDVDVDDDSATTTTPAIRVAGVGRGHGNARPQASRNNDIYVGSLGRTQVITERPLLWVCDRCFKYMADGPTWDIHAKTCDRMHPPGKKVYHRGAHVIWEVDGAKDKLYCQNLSLFGKLFIDTKTLFFDCENFLFYILTDADSTRDHVLGFFSKEKTSYDDYNLACIITLPPYQRKGYGMLLIEFSYELSRRAGKVGTPERPLSDLGLRSYLTYWVSTLIRYFRRLLSVVPPENSALISRNKMPDLNQLRSPSRDSEESIVRIKRRKSTKGWDGEVVDPGVALAPIEMMTGASFRMLVTKMRAIETLANADGSATSHVVVKCTLVDIANATNLRVEDTAFALNECGLLVRRYKGNINPHANGHGAGRTTSGLFGRGIREGEEVEVEEVIMVTREMVEAVAKDRKVKKACMELAHVVC
ncbi:hypothetical protein FIBSPDRAFT_820112 [Athelia psychrophila]|uniref:histone acetyltransferase n=1 Tax=Athelia psychrophila TaxID=1759441 RepID=A0A166PG40_9AGAM|nr:hypothetical protein FIBSPDRAFT_820112 [Fibularhizoctonia sp. CBS 109695]